MIEFGSRRFATVDEAEREALGLLNGYHLEKAEGLARAILATDRTRPVAAAVLGIALYRNGRPVEALMPLSRASALAPTIHDISCYLGLTLLATGQAAVAEQEFRHTLAARPDAAEALYGLGVVAETRGDEGTAFELYAKALRHKENFSPCYIAYSRLCFRRTRPDIGPAFGRRPRDAAKPLLAAGSLADYGRFAQTVAEYVALRLYAARQGMDLVTPDWVGHYFFDLDDPLQDMPVRRRRGRHAEMRDQLRAGLNGLPHEALEGEAFLNGAPFDVYRVPFRDEIRALLRPRPMWQARLTPVIDGLRRGGGSVVALHLRAGDLRFLNKVPAEEYFRLLDELFARLPSPVLYIASSAPQLREMFGRYRPLMLGDVAEPWRGLEYLQDFHVLTQADAVVCDVGQFSLTAAALNERARHFYRVAEGQRLEAFQPWTPGLP